MLGPTGCVNHGLIDRFGADVVWGHFYRPRLVQAIFAGCATPRSNLAVEVTGGIELLDAVVLAIRNIDIAAPVRRYADRAIEPALGGTESSPGQDVLPQGIELLDPMVAGIGHVNVIITVNRNPPRTIKLAVCAARTAPFQNLLRHIVHLLRRFWRRKLPYLVGTLVHHVDIACAIRGNVGEIYECAGFSGTPFGAVPRCLKLALSIEPRHDTAPTGFAPRIGDINGGIPALPDLLPAKIGWPDLTKCRRIASIVGHPELDVDALEAGIVSTDGIEDLAGGTLSALT